MSQLHLILPLLKCPACHHPDLEGSGNGLLCLGCNTRYDIVENIPNFAPHIESDSPIGQIQEVYEKNAHYYEQRMRYCSLPLLGSNDKEMRALAQSIAGGGGWLLEVSVGPGNFSFEIYKSNQQTYVVAVDLAWSMLRQAKYKARTLNLTNVFLVRADAAHLPFKRNVFDALLSLNGLHVFPDPKGILETMWKVTKPYARIGGCCPVSGVDGLGGWLMKTFQQNNNVPPLTLQLMTTHLQDYWPTVKIECSGAILKIKRTF